MIIRVLRPAWMLLVAGRLGVAIGVVHRFRKNRRLAGPKAAAAHLVRIGVPRDRVRETRDARMLRRPSTGEPRRNEVEAAPEEVHRTRLADEVAAKLLHDARRVRE